MGPRPGERLLSAMSLLQATTETLAGELGDLVSQYLAFLPT